MINIRFLLFAVVVSLLGMLSVSAELSTNLADDKITLGSESQDASNYNKEIDVFLSKDIEIATTDDLTLTFQKYDSASQFISSSNTISAYNINVSFVKKSETSATTTVTVTARIPEALDAVDANGVASAFPVAKLLFSDGSESAVIDLYMQRKNHISFDEVYLNYNDENEKLNGDEKIDNLKAGDGATFEFKVENTFSSSADVEIDDVTVYVEDKDNDLDLDEDETLGTIKENDDDSGTISFDVADDLDEDTYDLFFRVLGEDEYGAMHGEQWTITIEIDKDKDDMAINRIDLNPDSATNCGASMVTLTVNVENIGSNAQDEATIKVESSGLRYSNIVGGIELDEGDSKTKQFSIPISESVSAGSYSVIVTTKNDDGEVTDERSLSLIVSSCTPSSSTPSTSDGSDDDADAGEVDVIYSNVDYGTAQPVDDDKETSAVMPMWMISLLFVLILIAVLVLFVVLLKN